MARNTNGIATFWDLAYLNVLIQDNVDPDENEEMVIAVARLMFERVGKPLGSTLEETKTLSQECPTKTEIETIYNKGNSISRKWIWYINNVDNYASNQLVKYSDLRYEIVRDSITVTPSSLNFVWNPTFLDGATNLTVESSGSWTAETTLNSGTINPSSGLAGTTNVLFNPGLNTSTQTRIGLLTFTCGSASDTVSWSQGAQVETILSITPTSVNFAALNPSSSSISVKCNTSWTASTTTSWINLSRTSGFGNQIVTISVDNNTGTSVRLGIVTFKSGSDTVTLRVSQSGTSVITKHYLTVSYNGSIPDNINATAYIDGVIRPSVTSMEQNPIRVCEITADDAGKSYTVRVNSVNTGVTCVPSQFTGTLPATISSNYNVGTFLVQYT